MAAIGIRPLGYDPNYSYAYNGPIYAYGNLPPDQVIANVQIELQQEGYYAGPINGSLDASTRAAISQYQRDNGLAISGRNDGGVAVLVNGFTGQYGIVGAGLPNTTKLRRR